MATHERFNVPASFSLRAIGDQIAIMATVGAAVFFACMFGIYTRPTGLLAAIWPANAILLGLFVIRPRLATPAGYIGATIGFFAADLFTGASLLKTALLTSANLAGVITGHLLFTLIPEPDRHLKRPYSVLYLFLISVTAACVSGLFGGIANPILFNQPVFSGWAFWFGTELVNYIAVLPVVLCFPALDANWFKAFINRRKRQTITESLSVSQITPAIALLLSGLLAYFFGGPGAVAFPMPALLWCAIAYHQWITSILVLGFTSWILMVITMDHVGAGINLESKEVILSIRLGIALATLGPIMVSSVMAARNELVARLARMASHDTMTGLLNRGAFREAASLVLARMRAANQPVVVLMVDIDHFKRINDTYGHSSGDQVLVSFARTLQSFLREGDTVGRIGGEEFAVLLPRCGLKEGMLVAERIRSTFGQASLSLSRGVHITATVSMGLAYAEHPPLSLDGLLEKADTALYRAKTAGRNCIETAAYFEEADANAIPTLS